MKIPKSWREFLQKDKKLVIHITMVVVVGAAMLLGMRLIPTELGRSGIGENNDSRVYNGKLEAYSPSSASLPMDFHHERALEERLEEIFSLVEGAGKVRVMISPLGGRETVFATDTNRSGSYVQEVDSQGGTRHQRQYSSQEQTVIVTDRTGVDRPLIVREIEPRVEGVVIIAEGGDCPFVRDALTRAASAVLSLGANRVQVLQMARD